MAAVVGNATPADTWIAGTIVPFDREHVLLKVGVSPRECQAAASFSILLCRAVLGSQLYTGRMQPEKLHSAFVNRNYAKGAFFYVSQPRIF